jgi:predicted acetyltransferase
MDVKVQYWADADVDEGLDCEIRELLTTCFRKPEDAVFRERRYFKEPYPHRWMIRDAQGRLVAHIGVHEKRALTGNESLPIAGMAEVCTHPAVRGRGYVRGMLCRIHEWLEQAGPFAFAMLFGDPRVYGSSGYTSVANLVYGGEREGWTATAAMVRPLSARPWPDGVVRLPGPKF